MVVFNLDVITTNSSVAPLIMVTTINVDAVRVPQQHRNISECFRPLRIILKVFIIKNADFQLRYDDAGFGINQFLWVPRICVLQVNPVRKVLIQQMNLFGKRALDDLAG